MKIFKQVAIIIGFSLLGEIISWVLSKLILNFFFPGSLIGLITWFVRCWALIGTLWQLLSYWPQALWSTSCTLSFLPCKTVRHVVTTVTLSTLVRKAWNGHLRTCSFWVWSLSCSCCCTSASSGIRWCSPNWSVITK